jgi:8-oxo-dGTP pyrophosphatase MutT (NUDIX family)
MIRTEGAVPRQYGALPFVMTSQGKAKILLITTRGRGGWIIPKGWPIPRLSAAATAAREAYEEAGLLGTIIGDAPIGSFRHEKQKSSQSPSVCEVEVFLFAVERQLRKWPERAERRTRWFAPAEAASIVTAEGLSALLLQSAEAMLAWTPPLLSGPAWTASPSVPRLGRAT